MRLPAAVRLFLTVYPDAGFRDGSSECCFVEADLESQEVFCIRISENGAVRKEYRLAAFDEITNDLRIVEALKPITIAEEAQEEPVLTS